LARKLSSTYFEITRKISSLEREILAFQAGVVGHAGAIAAGDSNLAIILASRLSTVWRRLGAAAQLRRKNVFVQE
jgi:hypothetical protein